MLNIFIIRSFSKYSLSKNCTFVGEFIFEIYYIYIMISGWICSVKKEKIERKAILNAILESIFDIFSQAYTFHGVLMPPSRSSRSHASTAAVKLFWLCNVSHYYHFDVTIHPTKRYLLSTKAFLTIRKKHVNKIHNFRAYVNVDCLIINFIWYFSENKKTFNRNKR